MREGTISSSTTTGVGPLGVHPDVLQNTNVTCSKGHNFNWKKAPAPSGVDHLKVRACPVCLEHVQRQVAGQPEDSGRFVEAGK